MTTTNPPRHKRPPLPGTRVPTDRSHATCDCGSHLTLPCPRHLATIYATDGAAHRSDR